MTTPEHQHVFRPADLRHDDGTPIPGGRRCTCGVEVVGDTFLAINANVVRVSRTFNQTVARAMTEFSREFERQQRRYFP